MLIRVRNKNKKNIIGAPGIGKSYIKNLRDSNAKAFKERPPHLIEGIEIWTYAQFMLNVLKTKPSDFLSKKETTIKVGRQKAVNTEITTNLTYLTSFVERYLEEDETPLGVSHLKEILEILSEDLKEHHPYFFARIRKYLDSEVLDEANNFDEKSTTELDKVIVFTHNLPEIIERFENSSVLKEPKEREEWKKRMINNINNVINIFMNCLQNKKMELIYQVSNKINLEDITNRIGELVGIRDKLIADEDKKRYENFLVGSYSSPSVMDDKEIKKQFKKAKDKIISKNRPEKDELVKHIEDRMVEKSVTTFKHLGKGLTLKEALKYSLPTRDSAKVKCKKCKGIYNKRHFYGHYKKHLG